MTSIRNWCSVSSAILRRWIHSLAMRCDLPVAPENWLQSVPLRPFIEELVEGFDPPIPVGFSG